jgi:hypothetical protein
MKFTLKSKQLIQLFSVDMPSPSIMQFKTQPLLFQLYNQIKEAEQYVKSSLKYKYKTKHIKHSSNITKPKFFNAKSFPEVVREHIDNHMTSEISYSFSLQDRKIQIHFIVENSIDKQETDRFIISIATWLYILNHYASKKCANTLNVYFYFTSLQKSLPSSNIHILDETNVNTAFTTTCPVDSEIIVFRKEEWFKVFIHETFHNFGLDFSGMNNDNITNCILDIFKVNSQVNAYEAYTEFWAEIINVIFCSYYSSKTNAIFLSNFEKYMKLEIMYSFFQLTKVLDFMGLKYKDLYSDTNRSTILRANMYKENTNVLAYYVLKTILLNNYQGMLHWCNKYNTKLLDFEKTTNNLKEFCLFIKKNYKSKAFLINMHEAEHYFESTKDVNGFDPYILSNMRMTICELG